MSTRALLAVCHIIPNELRSNLLFPDITRIAALKFPLEMKQIAGAAAARVAQITGRAEGEYELIVDDGTPQGEKIDLIVLGTHGRSGLARVIMGSVAEAVVRSAPCQVLTIGPKVPAIEEAAAPMQAVAEISQSRCLVCAKPSQQTICDSCKAYIQGEAIERKRREEQPGHRGLSF